MTANTIVNTIARAYTLEEIRINITTNRRWTERAIVVIYRYQTSAEQRRQETIEHNGVGFNGVDASFMSSLAQQIISGRSLTERQLVVAQRKIGKYAGQLLRIINSAANTMTSRPSVAAVEDTRVFSERDFSFKDDGTSIYAEASTIRFRGETRFSVNGIIFTKVSSKVHDGEIVAWVFKAANGCQAVIFND